VLWLFVVATDSGKENIKPVNSAAYFIRHPNAARAFYHVETGICLHYIKMQDIEMS